MNNKSSKINNGCLNIFKFLILLYEDDACYEKVSEIFKNDLEGENRINMMQVVLNKYINAMKVFGIKIHKINNKFHLESSLYSMNYTLEDLKSLSILINASENIPDEDITKEISDFTSKLMLRMNNNDKNTLNTLRTNYDFSFFYTDLIQQIEDCREYCKNKQQLKIIYLKKNKEISITCMPKELIYDVKTAYLKIYDYTTNANAEIALPSILSVMVLPQTTKKMESATTVVYKLKGRLAKTYKLKENEKLDKIENGYAYIINTNEPHDKLFSRLMRYSYLCEIVSPKYMRRQMFNLINETIDLYNE